MSSFLRFAKLQIIWWAPNIGLSFIGNWDYYLFMRHGEDFFTSNTWEGYRGAFPENLTPPGRQQSHISGGVSPYLSDEALKRNRRIGIALIVAFIVVELVKATLLSSAEMGNKVVFNNGELYYSSSVSETHVNQLGNYLIRAGIFGGDQVSAKLDKKGSTYQVRLIVREGVVMNPRVLTGMQHLASGISRQVFGGAQVEVHLCNSQFETLRVVSSTQSGAPSQHPWSSGGSIFE